MAIIYINDKLKEKIALLKSHPRDTFGDIIAKYLPPDISSETQTSQRDTRTPEKELSVTSTDTLTDDEKEKILAIPPSTNTSC